MLKNVVLVCAVMSLLVAKGVAQNGQGRGHFNQKSTIAVTVDGLTCANGQGTIPALTWSFGATVPTEGTTGSGGATGHPSLTDLSITRRADACTPVLFDAVVKIKHINKVMIVQQDTQKDDVFVVTLDDVIISSFQIGGDQSSELPTEKLGFNFAKICIADQGAGTKTCWDLTKGTAF